MNFLFENEDYVIMPTEYVSEYIQIPDGRILKADYWVETNPPQPEGLKVVSLPENHTATPAIFQEKDVSFIYENEQYLVTDRINLNPYIVLPNNKVIEISGYEEGKGYVFKEAKIDVEVETLKENVIKADSLVLSKKLKM